MLQHAKSKLFELLQESTNQSLPTLPENQLTSTSEINKPYPNDNFKQYLHARETGDFEEGLLS
jgi:hypothetical protein